MIVDFIQSLEAQEISDKIHYTNMVNDYNAFVWNGNPNEVPENKATPERLMEIWGAGKLFLDCTEFEAIEQYSLAGFVDGLPLIPLQGVTTSYATPKTIEGNDNCIPIPLNGLEGYDLSSFTYEIIEINFED